MLANAVDEEMQIVTKEILDHLRAALDYCAREVWEALSGGPPGAIVYFPIAREGAKASDFAALMNARMPGVPAAAPAAVATFSGFQEFANADNVWLPELATLANAAKHEHLNVAHVPEALLNMRLEDGVQLSSFELGHGPKRHTPWMALIPRPGGSVERTTYEARFLVLGEINVELSRYLREAITGITQIIAGCEVLLDRN